MRAVKIIGVGKPAQIEDVAKPSPAPGQVLIKIGGAVAVYGPWGYGRCHACQLSMENYCEKARSS